MVEKILWRRSILALLHFMLSHGQIFWKDTSLISWFRMAGIRTSQGKHPPDSLIDLRPDGVLLSC